MIPELPFLGLVVKRVINVGDIQLFAVKIEKSIKLDKILTNALKSFLCIFAKLEALCEE